jgi:hypothetical protein
MRQVVLRLIVTALYAYNTRAKRSCKSIRVYTLMPFTVKQIVR